ncbi:uncharacterized protein CLAFUR5_00200 [Fulvia fulva]|uniref:Uncharacterized protein n=1 Tax=Passalora fulva TaxID=5499 RepID=A0A9Q8L722_PASFU|nr:uncharacterized protein CLAFUR5_00200 [Fulvia fulva]KAK4636942.1 hypothetical protein CLAFUR0_00201 [Fulvia fulva]UJO12048.1 hypothetical protein CLAFUR5_00200 [Fulvia fulva]WPV24845.1 hypothetical protein CLAFUW7_00203 [Fulvia fulva]
MFAENTWLNVIPRTNGSVLAPPATRHCSPGKDTRDAYMADADLPQTHWIDEENDNFAREDDDSETGFLVLQHRVTRASGIC